MGIYQEILSSLFPFVLNNQNDISYQNSGNSEHDVKAKTLLWDYH